MRELRTERCDASPCSPLSPVGRGTCGSRQPRLVLRGASRGFEPGPCLPWQRLGGGGSRRWSVRALAAASVSSRVSMDNSISMRSRAGDPGLEATSVPSTCLGAVRRASRLSPRVGYLLDLGNPKMWGACPWRIIRAILLSSSAGSRARTPAGHTWSSFGGRKGFGACGVGTGRRGRFVLCSSAPGVGIRRR